LAPTISSSSAPTKNDPVLRTQTTTTLAGVEHSSTTLDRSTTDPISVEASAGSGDSGQNFSEPNVKSPKGDGVIHNHSLVLALTSDSEVPNSDASNSLAGESTSAAPEGVLENTVDETASAAVADGSTANADGSTNQTAVAKISRSKRSSTTPMLASGLVLFGLLGLWFARRFT
jgi:hypothetical protein